MEEKKPVRNEVIRVRNRNGKEILISPDDFDPERYERVTADTKEPLIVETVVVKKPALDPFSLEPEEELLTWSRNALREMPEYPFIEKKPIDKNGIVTEIMKVRERRINGEL